MKMKRKNIELAVLLGLICCMLLSLAHFDAACDDLRGSVLRLHILANSDSPEDQAVKLLVRDALLEQTGGIFDGQTDLHSAEEAAQENLEQFCAVADRVLAENGFSYTAEAAVGDSYFENREYEDFTLPAGTYRSLIIRLGNAEGKNWWCVVFPSVCIPAAGGDLSDSAGEEGCEIAKQPARYTVRFKAVEIYEDLKHFFTGK